MKVTKFMVHKNNIHWQVISGALLSTSFLVLGVGLLHPFTIDSANADSKNTAVSLRIGESIMVPEVSTDSINIELDPTAANGDFKTASVTVGVSTNRTAGYTLTASVEGSETALTNADYDNYEIAALGGKTAATTFADLDDSDSMNKWGYATDNNGDGEGQTEAGYYYAMPDVDNPTTLKITDGPAATSNTEITFATKGKDLAAGKYENTVVFTAIGNLETPASIEDGMKMQDVTPEMCENEETLDYGNNRKTYTLIDSRDDNEYQVRKLADGHCWMVTNLRLGKTSTMTLYSSDTDIIDDAWDLPANSTLTYSYDEPRIHIGTADDCANNNCWTTSWGNYYNWTAATAGQGTDKSAANGDIDVSICPKGWKLPKRSSNTIDYSWAKLYAAYSSNAVEFQAFTNTGIRYQSGIYNSGSLEYAGSSGCWWSRTKHINSTGYAYYLTTSSGGTYSSYRVDPQDSYNLLSLGASIRCVLSNE